MYRKHNVHLLISMNVESTYRFLAMAVQEGPPILKAKSMHTVVLIQVCKYFDF